MSRSALEPTLANFSNPFLRYFAATRPAFLVATLAACLLGQAGAIYSGIQIQPLTAVLTVLLALIVHAGVNVINDYFDALNGTDASNTERLYPFTGGSRFIQNGILTPKQIAHFGY
ncbi:MAG: prenyltransferase, partial [Methylotenera sp.]|nr:prenyltransferase [Methylotenera sp.]